MTQRLRVIHTQSGTLSKKLTQLHSLSSSWGATYWYTSPNLPAEYRVLNNELVAAVSHIFKSYGLKFDGKVTNSRLHRLGISLFNESVDRAKIKQLQSADKSKRV